MFTIPSHIPITLLLQQGRGPGGTEAVRRAGGYRQLPDCVARSAASFRKCDPEVPGKDNGQVFKEYRWNLPKRTA